MSQKPTIAKGSIVADIQQEIPEAPDALLVSILRTKRCHNSTGDTNFRLWLHQQIKSLGFTPQILAEGCVFVRVDEKSDTLFSCHIDTCHSQAESDGSVQDLAYDPTFGHIVLAQGSKSGCLGADDGVGVYIMLKMIAAKVPGSYIFHTGEERGCIGSRAVLHKHRELLDDFSRAIAFDRPNNFEVIVTQGRECASVTMGEALAKALNDNGMMYEVSHRGVVTDTKIYADVIPECINLGVGYGQQHGPNEYLDVAHVEALLKAAIAIKWDELPTVRKPGPVIQPPSPGYGGGFKPSFGGTGDFWGVKTTTQKPKNKKKPVSPFPEPRFDTQKALPDLDIVDEIRETGVQGLVELCETAPEEAAEMMLELTLRTVAAEAKLRMLESMVKV